MTLYQDHLYQTGNTGADGIPDNCFDIADKISYTIGYEEYLCLRSLIMQIKQLEDRIKELEQKQK